MRLFRTALLTIILCILFAFESLAITEYPWTGSEKDASRAGGLGWITVTEELVLPGTKECSVTIFQSGDERWGYMAGEEDPDEFHWAITLYEEDNYSARVQLPFSTYTTYYLGCNAVPEEYQCNIPNSAAVEWFPLNGLMLEETSHNHPEKVSSSCRLSEENPEGELANDLIMVFKEEDSINYDKDISFIFDGKSVQADKAYETIALYDLPEESIPEKETFSDKKFRSFYTGIEDAPQSERNLSLFAIIGIIAAIISVILIIKRKK